MEIKQKKKTLVGLFLKFAVYFCVNTALIVGGCVLLLIACAYFGFLLPANYAEQQLNVNAQAIKEAENPEQWIPKGCDYGVYAADGTWQTGSFAETKRASAWSGYESQDSYAWSGNYYRFIRQDNGNVCIVRYDLKMKYASELLNERLPSPELMSFVLDGILFLLNAVLLSRHFAKRLNVQLRELGKITDAIAENDLEFDTKPSDIREINAVMESLSRLKDALKLSLKRQWDMEQQKKEQMSALTHDIKTPLTVIRGNAELLAEEALTDEDAECVSAILTNVGSMERYLENMKQLLHGEVPRDACETLSCNCLGELLCEMAEQLAAAEKIPVKCEVTLPEGYVRCRKTDIIRAWNNILSNAAEHTKRAYGIRVQLYPGRRGETDYLTAVVRDHGAGFTERELSCAAEEFYSGDTSRHDRSHQGLGLAIAKKFMEEQGGFLQFANNSDRGAMAALWIRIQKDGDTE